MGSVKRGTSKVDDYKVPTLKTRLITALTKMELLKRKVSGGGGAGKIMVLISCSLNESMNDESVWDLLSMKKIVL